MTILQTQRFAIIGAYWGSMFTARRVKCKTLVRIFALALVLLAIQRIVVLWTA